MGKSTAEDVSKMIRTLSTKYNIDSSVIESYKSKQSKDEMVSLRNLELALSEKEIIISDIYDHIEEKISGNSFFNMWYRWYDPSEKKLEQRIADAKSVDAKIIAMLGSENYKATDDLSYINTLRAKARAYMQHILSGDPNSSEAFFIRDNILDFLQKFEKAKEGTQPGHLSWPTLIQDANKYPLAKNILAKLSAINPAYKMPVKDRVNANENNTNISWFMALWETFFSIGKVSSKDGIRTRADSIPSVADYQVVSVAADEVNTEVDSNIGIITASVNEPTYSEKKHEVQKTGVYQAIIDGIDDGKWYLALVNIEYFSETFEAKSLATPNSIIRTIEIKDSPEFFIRAIYNEIKLLENSLDESDANCSDKKNTITALKNALMNFAIPRKDVKKAKGFDAAKKKLQSLADEVVLEFSSIDTEVKVGSNMEKLLKALNTNTADLSSPKKNAEKERLRQAEASGGDLSDKLQLSAVAVEVVHRL
jgi:hypothetical protein